MLGNVPAFGRDIAGRSRFAPFPPARGRLFCFVYALAPRGRLFLLSHVSSSCCGRHTVPGAGSRVKSLAPRLASPLFHRRLSSHKEMASPLFFSQPGSVPSGTLPVGDLKDGSAIAMMPTRLAFFIFPATLPRLQSGLRPVPASRQFACQNATGRRIAQLAGIFS